MLFRFSIPVSLRFDSSNFTHSLLTSNWSRERGRDKNQVMSDEDSEELKDMISATSGHCRFIFKGASEESTR